MLYAIMSSDLVRDLESLMISQKVDVGKILPGHGESLIIEFNSSQITVVWSF